MVVARGKEYTLPEISAFILRKAKAIAEAALGGPVERAVITVPANFDDLQRAATKLAGQLAGLQVLRVLNEPTAAALAYGYGREGQERILVYDFGGGTFDVTVLERVGDVFRVQSTAGDMYLGGDDVDAAIANRIAEGFAAKHFYDPRADKQVFEHLRSAAEKLKITLSSEERGSVALDDVVFGVGGKSLRYEHEMQRSELAALVDPLVERTVKVVKRALDQAGLHSTQMDQVILVGGTTLVSRVRERVAELFGREPAEGVSPFEAVAVGAAIQAYAMTEAAPADDSTYATADSVRLSRTVVTFRPPPPVLDDRAPAHRPAPAPEPVRTAEDVPLTNPRNVANPALPPAAVPARPAWIGWTIAAVAVALVVVGVAILLR
jgi:molecular chaperone DnaK